MPNGPSYVDRAPFNFAPEVWNAAKIEIRNLLIAGVRRADPTIPYSDLVARVNTIHFNPTGYDQRLFAMLGEISIDEHDAGRPLLSVLVVHKHGDKRPGPGFFELARHLGHSSRDTEAFWASEFAKVQAHWR